MKKKPTNKELAKCANLSEQAFELLKDKTLDEMQAFACMFGMSLRIEITPRKIKSTKKGQKK